MSKLFYNGEIIDAAVRPGDLSDRGGLLGDGIFETLKVSQGRPEFFTAHWGRFEKAAKAVAIPVPYDKETVRQAINDLLGNREEAVVRWTLTRGSNQRGIGYQQPITPSFYLTVGDYHASTTDLRVILSSIKRNEHSPSSRLKSLNYLDAVLARQEALEQGYDDALFCNTEDRVICGTVYNLFLIKDDRVITAGIDEGVLPGVIRQQVLNTCQTLGIDCEEKALGRQELATVEAAFLTNSLVGVRQIAQIGAQRLVVDQAIVKGIRLSASPSSLREA